MKKLRSSSNMRLDHSMSQHVEHCWGNVPNAWTSEAPGFVMVLLHIDKKCGLVSKPCPTLSDPMGCSLPGSSVHGTSQARILEWTAISFSRGSSQPRDQTWVSCIGRWILYWATKEALAKKQKNQKRWPLDRGKAGGRTQARCFMGTRERASRQTLALASSITGERRCCDKGMLLESGFIFPTLLCVMAWGRHSKGKGLGK